jgi:hypothetical protein
VKCESLILVGPYNAHCLNYYTFDVIALCLIANL